MNTFRPSTSQYRRFALGLVPVAAVILILDFFRYRNDPLLFGILTIAAFALAGGYLLLYFRNTRVEARFHELTTRNFLRRSRTFSADQLDRIVMMRRYSPGTYGSSEYARLIVLDTTGKSVLSWFGQMWTDEEMTGLMTSLGITVDRIDDTITPAQLRQRYPNAVSWATAHPWKFAWIVAGAVLLVIVVAVVIAVGVTS